MIDDKDIQKMIEVFATKEDIKELRQDVAGLQEAVQSLITSVDKLAKAVDDLRTEYVAITSQMDRHEKWIKQMADKLGIKLEY
jgi:uncharacterized protein YlxW (UPF0749 family)